ncbi:MAG: glycosyltransferase family 39 protein [Chloroflexi bacterium]|nr:glycosyltransferase family 39 protein [Chloroflexota bacterium]
MTARPAATSAVVSKSPTGLPAGREAVPLHSRRAWVVDLVVGATILATAIVVLLRAVDTVPFHGDESEWINNGRYFRYVFLDADLTSSVWRPSWVNRDQPPFGRYIIGGIVWASGTDPARVNRTYNWERDYEANLRDGRIPGPNILLPVRRTMAVLGALSILLLFVAGRMVGGTVCGAVAALFATFSPLLQAYFVQARTEALLALFSVVGLIALLRFASHYQRMGTLGLSGWCVGPMMGIALATKLTAAVAILGVCAYGGIAGLARLRADRAEAFRMIGWSLATGLLATAVWVVVNPFLWPDPAGRTWSMLEQQQSIMVEQGVQFGNPVDLSLPARLLLMVQRTFVENSTPAFDMGLPPGSPSVLRRTFTELPAPFGVSLELILAAAGLAALLARALSVWRAGARPGPETALLWWLAAYLLGIGANLSLDWPRYYVPTAYFGALLIGLGTGAILSAALQATGRPVPESLLIDPQAILQGR